MGKKIQGSSFVKQAAILAAASLIVRFIGFLYRLPMTTLIGDVGNAIYGAGYQVYNLLLILSSAGIPAAIGKMVSERLAYKEYKNAHKVFTTALVCCGGISFLFMVVMFFCAELIAVYICKIPEAEYTLVSLAPTVFIVGIMSVFRGYFQGMNNMVPTAISQVVEQIFNAIFSVLLAWVFMKESVALGAAGGTAGTGIGAFFGLLVMLLAYYVSRPTIKRKVTMKTEYKEESFKEVAKVLALTAMPIILGTAIYSITNLADMSMVMDRLLISGAFTYEEALELYGQLQGKYVVLTTLPVAISTAVATAAVPNIAASMALNNKEDVERKINMSIKLAMMVSIPAAVGMGVLSDEILLLIFPTAPEGGDLLRVGSIAIVFLALSQIVTGTLQGIGKVHVPAVSAFFGAVVKIILNYFLISIPSINVIGAIISTIVCYMIASGRNLFVLIKVTKFTPDLIGAIVKPFIASGVMGVACFLIYEGLFILNLGNSASTIISVIISMAIYGVVLLIIKGVNESEIKSLPMGGKILKIAKKLKLI